MPRKPSRKDPFEVSLSKEDLKDLAIRLSEEIQGALDARQDLIGDDQRIDHWHFLYEGGDERITKNTPWPGAANLTSWIGTEKVDAIRARVVQTIFTDPIWIVEGWGESAQKVPFVEAFHQWKAEEERLQSYVSKVVHNALIEGTGVLEVAERPVARKIRTRMKAAVITGSDGVPAANPDNSPIIKTGPDGLPVPAGEGEPSADVVLDRVGKVRNGPQYRILSLKDYVHLPGHATDKADVWGYAKRFWKRVPELKGMEKLGIYSNVDELGLEDEREPRSEHGRQKQNIAVQKGPTAEKELWEILFLADFDEDGIEEWYVATLHIGKQVILRLQKDDLGQARYILFTPFPRANSLYGYPFMQKLDSIIQEHTAWRNMIADRSNLVTNAPLLRVFGSMWDPKAQPFGPGRVMVVRSKEDVFPLLIPDVPSSAVHREGTVIAASERISGLVDEASGSHPREERTLGEVKIVTTSSLVRVEEIVKHLQEAMEDLFSLRHEIYVRTERENPEPFPSGLMAALEDSGMRLPKGPIDVTMLEGTFRGKPHGSVESADRTVQRQDFIGFLTAFGQYAQAVPTAAAVLSDPGVTAAIMNQAMRIFRWETRGTMTAALERAVQAAQAAGLGSPQQMAGGVNDRNTGPEGAAGGSNPVGRMGGPSATRR